MEARQAIDGDVQLARRIDSISLPRWIADKELEQLVLAIVRNLPLKEPSVLTVKGLRRILLVIGGVSARIFRMLNDVAIEAIETGVERITDEALERYKPRGGRRGDFPVIDDDDAHRPLPVVLKPVDDELLSSWLARHAAYYGDKLLRRQTTRPMTRNDCP